MKAVVLLGGLGSRLKPLTLERPKPLISIMNRPFITYQIDLLKRFGVRDVVLALGHKAAFFKRALGDGKKFGVRFTYSLEKEPLGTGGAIRLALQHIKGPTFVLNGDVLSDFDLEKMAREHRVKKSDATLALVSVENPSAFGSVEMGRAGRVLRFLEKPTGTVFPCRTINAGCYLFEPRVVERIPSGQAVSIERDIFPALLTEGYRVHGFVHEGYWSDIGTLPTYWKTHQDLHAQKRWPAGVKNSGSLWFEAGTRVDGARVLGTVLLGKNVRVAKDVVFEGAVTVGDGVRIGAGAFLRDCVVLEKSRVGARAHVDRSIVGVGAVVKPDAGVGPDQVFAGEGQDIKT